METKTTIALCYDFDGTLCSGNMYDYSFFDDFGIEADQFWNETGDYSKSHEADPILSYMSLLLEKSEEINGLKLTKEYFNRQGGNVELFPGVGDWFERISKYGLDRNVQIEHYIISSGLKEIIEGTTIGNSFKRIYASSYIYDKNGVAKFPALAINYTTKTQYIFRINKGALDVYDNSKINAYVEHDERPIPFKNIIFIGDGETDIPCMSLVKSQGGHSVAIYQDQKAEKADKLLKEGRVNLTSLADYRESEKLDCQIKLIIDDISIT